MFILTIDLFEYLDLCALVLVFGLRFGLVYLDYCEPLILLFYSVGVDGYVVGVLPLLVWVLDPVFRLLLHK